MGIPLMKMTRKIAELVCLEDSVQRLIDLCIDLLFGFTNFPHGQFNLKSGVGRTFKTAL